MLSLYPWIHIVKVEEHEVVAKAQAELTERAARSQPILPGDPVPIINDPEGFWAGRWSL
jgi:hypothetical protein